MLEVGTVVISTEEYGELITRNLLFENIKKHFDKECIMSDYEFSRITGIQVEKKEGPF